VGRALVLLWNESARVVDPADFQLYTWEDWSRLHPQNGEPFIQAVRQRLRVPEVIALAEYDRLPTAAVSFSRRNVFKRDHWACQYCGRQGRQPVLSEQGSDEPASRPNPRANINRLRRQLGSEELSIDHVVPRSQGGVSSWDNCVLACIDCNKRKADRTPREAGMKLRKAPVRPKWKPLYARHDVRIASWSKFVSETYWNVRLEE
jgi:5-methylcytosine-specific restriction endonuclease McrA